MNYPKKNLNVTEPYLPPLTEFIPFLESIWQSKVVTNDGPLNKKLEESLARYLSVKNLITVNSGTNGLLVALKLLNLSGEVITTPYTFIATSHSLLWNDLRPVFVDIDKESFNIDPNKIENAITEKTSAILATHCYGRPCNVKKIQKIGKKYGLKVIYDAAHAFGINIDGESILNYGDISILSFHGTKIFNTFEGGAIASPNRELIERAKNLRNFGISSETEINDQGINAKLNEVCAAMGLLQLDHFPKNIAARQTVANHYREKLSKIRGIKIPAEPKSSSENFNYFPILIEESFPDTRDKLYQRFRKNNILARRYFYPLVSDFKMYSKLPSATRYDTPVARHIADHVLCLPIHPNMTAESVRRVIKVIEHRTTSQN